MPMKSTGSVQFRLRTRRAMIIRVVVLLIVSTAPALQAQSGPSTSLAYNEIHQRVVANTNSFYLSGPGLGVKSWFPIGLLWDH